MATPSEWIDKPEVVVLGAGVIGLTTALKIQEHGDYKVTIVAETLPSDPKSVLYTSHWAGAHLVSLAGDDVRQRRMDKETFDVMWKLSEPGGQAEGCFLRLSQTECYAAPRSGPHDLEDMPDFCWMKKEELPEGATCGVRFTTLTIDTSQYLHWLCARFLAAGGSLVRGSVQHISQLSEGGARAFGGLAKGPTKPPAALVICPGLAARSLGGVEDQQVYPVRGQTLLLRAPWIREGHTLTTDKGQRVYTVPRKSGNLLVGGTRDANDWYPHPRPETTRSILAGVLKLAPDIVPPRLRADPDGPPQVEDAQSLIIEEGCGFRPARHGGIRLEVDWIPTGPNSERKIPVVFHYGHGGYGFQSSWGSASMALELLEGALKEGESAKDSLNKMAASGVPDYDVEGKSW